MYKLRDATWKICLNKSYSDEIKRQLNDILPFVPVFSNELAEAANIIVGTPDSSDEVQLASEKGFIDLSGYGADDHLIKTISTDANTNIVIAGLTEKAALYGVFSFLEETGFYFLASGTICSFAGADAIIPDFNLDFKTKNKWRGMFVSFCMVSTSIMSVADFANLFDNMLRMKLNRIIFYPFENEPIIDYVYKGERKLVGDISRPESGYFSYGRNWTGSFNVDEISVGREKFAPRRRVAPMEFQDAGSSEEALDIGKDFMNDIIKEAAKRKIGVWIAFLPQFVSMNMRKFLKPMPRKNLHWSALVSCTDSAAKEMNAARIKNIVESYPGLEGLFVGIPEGFYEDPHKESREYIKAQLPAYENALKIQKKYWGDHWPGDELQKKHIEADIAFSKIAVEALQEASKYKPGISLGLITICKAYLLTKLDELIPKDIAFCDIESRSLWTHGGAPLFLFKKMPGRDCSIIPRITDDGSQAGMQFNLNLYYKDGYSRSTLENGTTGLMMQTLHIKGADHNIKYLSEGLWNYKINPDVFYDKYLKNLYGAGAAVKIRRAYELLEANEEFMGGRGATNMPWNHVPPEIAVMRMLKDADNPNQVCPLGMDFINNSKKRAGIYRETIKHLDEAAGIFDSAYDECNEKGKNESVYMSVRSKAYSAHLSTLVLLSELYVSYSNAFSGGDIPLKFRKIIRISRSACESAIKTAKLFSQCVVHTTDLAPLWMINSSMVKGTHVLLQFLKNILAFQEGREYQNPVDWEELFGECPYPAHGVDIETKDDKSADEPG